MKTLIEQQKIGRNLRKEIFKTSLIINLSKKVNLDTTIKSLTI